MLQGGQETGGSNREKQNAQVLEVGKRRKEPAPRRKGRGGGKIHWRGGKREEGRDARVTTWERGRGSEPAAMKRREGGG